MTLILAAAVDPSERPGVTAAAAQLGEAIGVAAEAVFLDAGARAPAGAILVRSLLPEVSRDEAIATTAARWRVRLADDHTAAAVILCTVFRHVADAGERPRAVERIRRLNLLVPELSHETGVYVADIDRLFALFGARMIGSGHRWTGRAPAELGGHAIATAVLATGLAGYATPERVETALAGRRRLGDIAATVQRRLETAR